MSIVLEATARTNIGKGASRRLRRLEDSVPAIVYGGEKEPTLVTLTHRKVIKALENEAIFSSLFDISIDGKKEHVILKALQRHPYRPIIMHMDFQRVNEKDVIVKNVPLHFINEESSKAIKAGGIATHNLTHVEIRCQVKHLPEFIEVDMSSVAMDEILHLSDLKLPKGVQFAVDQKDGTHDLPVVSVHASKAAVADEGSEESAAE